MKTISFSRSNSSVQANNADDQSLCTTQARQTDRQTNRQTTCCRHVLKCQSLSAVKLLVKVQLELSSSIRDVAAHCTRQ